MKLSITSVFLIFTTMAPFVQAEQMIRFLLNNGAALPSGQTLYRDGYVQGRAGRIWISPPLAQGI
jgi:hypothetical protein